MGWFKFIDQTTSSFSWTEKSQMHIDVNLADWKTLLNDSTESKRSFFFEESILLFEKWSKKNDFKRKQSQVDIDRFFLEIMPT